MLVQVGWWRPHWAESIVKSKLFNQRQAQVAPDGTIDAAGHLKLDGVTPQIWLIKCNSDAR